QRVAVARALAGRPKLILADEPTAALDPERARTVVQMLQTFAKENQCTVVIVTHDAGIRSVADRIVNMNKGGRIESDVLVQEAARIIEFLKANKLFAALPVSTLTELAVKMTLDVFAPGEEVVRQGEPGDELFVIRSGKADVLVARDGEARKVATLEAGDFFGEAALETGAPRNATVKAVERLTTYVLGKHDYEQAKAASKSFADEVRRVLITRQQDL
ncbi:MAG: cyclic nucleotide-binding domain-containing protein, partial [Pirellulales bacterium]